jgi:hypothetical protein
MSKCAGRVCGVYGMCCLHWNIVDSSSFHARCWVRLLEDTH